VDNYIPDSVLINFLRDGEEIEVYIDEQLVPGKISQLSITYNGFSKPNVTIVTGSDEGTKGSLEELKDFDFPMEEPSEETKSILPPSDSLNPSPSGIEPMSDRVVCENEHIDILNQFNPERVSRQLKETDENYRPMRSVTIRSDACSITDTESVRSLLQDLAVKEAQVFNDYSDSKIRLISPPTFVFGEDEEGVYIEEKIVFYERTG